MQLKDKKILITGGLGFIGFNAAVHFSKNNKISIVDDCSRNGVVNNIAPLRKKNVEFHKVDISNFEELRNVYSSFAPDVILHMAAQTAVTLSIVNPVRDFKTNAIGSFNLLELARSSRNKPIILYASTNKVYGSNIGNTVLQNGRYRSEHPYGCNEKTPLSFQTPYACSKGMAEQYFTNYARFYNIPIVTFRQSCIYGPHQCGMEDQGWLTWFTLCSHHGKPLTIFGDGNQVRDVLHIDDLIRLYDQSILHIHLVKGEVFNIGGGLNFTLSLNELVKMLNERNNEKLNISFSDWRSGDQKVYVSDIRKIEAALGWKPRISPHVGISMLIDWVKKKYSPFALQPLP